MSGKKLNYSTVERFKNCTVPQEVEDDILETFAKYSIDHDMTVQDTQSYFEDLQLPRELYKLIRKEDIVIDGTDVVDFDKIVRQTFHLLIFMNNEDVINSFWALLLKNSGRSEKFPEVKLKDHILSIKDLQKVDVLLNNNNSSNKNTSGVDIIGMLTCATYGSRVYMTYLDFADVLGRLGYLQF
ncbi:DNA repair protein Rad33p [Monosporozyma unispora]|nr:hypothetical protein C6P44_001734 [Kazachstania unispora]